MRFFYLFFICFFGISAISNQLLCSSYESSSSHKTKSKNEKKLPVLLLSKNDKFFLHKLYSKKNSSENNDYSGEDSDESSDYLGGDSLEDFDSALSDSNENDNDSIESPKKQLLQFNILSKSHSEKDSSLKDADFVDFLEDDFPEIGYINLDSTDDLDQISFQDKSIIYTSARPLLFLSPQKKREEMHNIFKYPNYIPGVLDQQEILYFKFVIHLFKSKKFEEIENQFVKQIPETSPPSTEDKIEKNRRGCLKEEIDICLSSLEEKLSKAPKFFKKTMNILNNPLCFIPIHEDIYEAFKKIPKIKLPSVFLTPIRLDVVRFVHTNLPPVREKYDPKTIYFELPSDISPDIGLRFYEINEETYMTLKKSNIQKCDLLLENWKDKKIQSPRKKYFKIMHLLGSQKRKAFLENDDFDEILRRSIVE